MMYGFGWIYAVWYLKIISCTISEEGLDRILHIFSCNATMTTDNFEGSRCCLFWRSQRREVKGKQVRILYDLVTVSREQKPGAYPRGHWETGKAAFCEDLQVRKPAVCRYGNLFPDHEALIVPFCKPQNAGENCMAAGVFLSCFL